MLCHILRWNLLSFSLCSLPLILYLDSPEKSLALSSASSLQAFTDIAKLFPLKYKNLYFLLSSFMRFLSAQFFSLSSWKAAQPHNLPATPLNFVPSMNWISVHSVLFSMSLIKILKRISCGIDHWGTPLVMTSSCSAVIQPVLIPRHCLLSQLIPHQFLYENLSHRRQGWKSYWTQGRKYSLLTPQIPKHSFHHARLPAWSSITSPPWTHADILHLVVTALLTHKFQRLPCFSHASLYFPFFTLLQAPWASKVSFTTSGTLISSEIPSLNPSLPGQPSCWQRYFCHG